MFSALVTRAEAAGTLEALVEDNAPWTLSPGHGRGGDHVFERVGDRTILTAGRGGVVLTRDQPLNGQYELVVVLRLTSPDTVRSSAVIEAGLAVPSDKSGSVPPLTVALRDDDSIVCAAPAVGELPALREFYQVKRLPQNRLRWPDTVRRRVEHDIAQLPGARDRWLTIRQGLRGDALHTDIDGRLLRHAVVTTDGYTRVTIWEGAQLASIRVTPLAPDHGLFLPVALDHHVNAGIIGGKAIDPDSLPKSSAVVTVGGVPYVLPQPDGSRSNHIDVGVSWLRAGLMEGGISGSREDAARWNGALDLDPARIQFRVRNGPYARLHLLAAFEGLPDTLPIVTAQFYRPGGGHPVSFVAEAPLFEHESSGSALPVRFDDGSTGRFHVVTIPLEPEGLSSLGEASTLEFELTKVVRVYRNAPDPIYTSAHAGGLPSGVRILAATLELPAVEVDWSPTQLAHVWTAPDTPEYEVQLRNAGSIQERVRLELSTRSYDELETTRQDFPVTLAPGQEQALRLPIALKRYGHHRTELRIHDSQGTRTLTGNLAFLHPDTRERTDWQEGRGIRFGFWAWSGAHLTPRGVVQLQLMHAVGAESCMRSFELGAFTDEDRAFAAAHGMRTPFLSGHVVPNHPHWVKDWDASRPEEMAQAIIAKIEDSPASRATAVNNPEIATFFAEPLLGPVSYMSLPHFYGEPAYELTDAEMKNLRRYEEQFIIGARAIKERFPSVRTFLPWGIPNFPIPFLWHSPEAMALMDGPALDIAPFERMPEMQMGQVTMQNEMWQLKQEWEKHTGQPLPPMITVEGPCISPSQRGSLTEEEEANYTVRSMLALMPYNTTQMLGWPSPFQPGNYWGESHYGGGLTGPLPLLSPKPVLSVFAAFTRQLNRRNFVKAVPTGSHTVYCFEFKHYTTHELLHVLWTIRGRRPVTITTANGQTPIVYDHMDNVVPVEVRDGAVTLSIGPEPIYVLGLSSDAAMKLGAPDHSDAAPAEHHVKLASLGDGSWSLSTERDAYYENNKPEFVRRFPGVMSVTAVDTLQAGKALAVRFEEQEKERYVMPYYTTLVPRNPVPIPGQASHLGMWVRASSDWGRIVYVLRDAKGEKWVSIGKPNSWNCDDIHSWSAFCFDGWRYLRFELPAHAPYDLYREAGTTWWGYSEDDASGSAGIVDLPLTVEKIIVERRTHVIYVNELVPADASDVLLGDLIAEYAQPADATDEAIRLSKLRMPLPDSEPELSNPIASLSRDGMGPPTQITSVEPPEIEYDGRRCHVHFNVVSEAAGYDVYVSTYSDGRGAVKLANSWTKPGELLRGLSPNVDLYLFVVWVDREGNASRPSAPFKINLRDMFPMK